MATSKNVIDIYPLIPADITTGSFDFACGVSYATFDDPLLTAQKTPIILTAKIFPDDIYYIAKNRLMLLDDYDIVLGIYLDDNKIQSIETSLFHPDIARFPGFTEEHKNTLINMGYSIASKEDIQKYLSNKYEII